MAIATLPVLWSFRRCPYAMRARLAIAASGKAVELREIVLRNKPAAFLAASPSATVPCLVADADVIDESLDIMHWAMAPETAADAPGMGLIARCDGPFKTALDLYKYAARHPDKDPLAAREDAAGFLWDLNTSLQSTPNLFGTHSTLADMAILPMVRQFAHVDLDWFTTQPWTPLISWLEDFKSSARFKAIMHKYPAWTPGDTPTLFPDPIPSFFK